MRRSLVRLIAWLPLAAFGLGVAMVVYLYVRYSPRCSIVAKGALLHVADDGEWLLTDTADAIHVWDARTGESKADYLAGMRNRLPSHDRRFLLGADEETLHVIDWRNDETRVVVIGEPIDRFGARFPWCVVTVKNAGWLLVDLRDGQIVRQFSKESEPWQWRDDGRFLVQDDEGIHLWNLAEMRVEATLSVGKEKLSEWSPRSGRWIVTSTVNAAKQERYFLWDLMTKSKRQAFLRPTGRAIPWTANGSRICSETTFDRPRSWLCWQPHRDRRC